MATHRQSRTWRRSIGTALAFVAAATAVYHGAATADTAADPGAADPNTRAALAPSTVSQATGQLPGSTLVGAVAGELANIHVDAAPGTLNSVTARLCRFGLGVVNPSEMDPTASGNCIADPFAGPANDAVIQASAGASQTTVDFAFGIGSGSQTFSYSGGTSTITCDDSSPCALWLDEVVDPSVNSTGHIFKHFDVTYAGPPGVPAATTTPGHESLAVDLTAPTAVGNTAAPLKYTVTISPAPLSGPASQTGVGLAYTFGSLQDFTNYTVTAKAASTAADGASAFTGPATSVHDTSSPSRTTPLPAPPTNVEVTPSDTAVGVAWKAPAGPAPTAYQVLASPTAGVDPRNTGSPATTYSFTGLSNGTVYTFQVRALYAGGTGPFSASSSGTTPTVPLSSQTITATRAQGDLVLTQICGAHGSTTTGTAPTYNGAPDPLFNQYPYPTDSNGNPTADYPTNCTIDLGTSHLLTTGPSAGQFFEATGVLNQVTVTDTRDSDPGFTVTGQMSGFTNGGPNANDSFSGSQLGWTPSVSSESPPFTASDGTTYAQKVSPGAPVAPDTPNPSGLSGGGILASAPAGEGLGIARLDADLKLWIPIYANHGTYVGTLTISAI